MAQNESGPLFTVSFRPTLDEHDPEMVTLIVGALGQVAARIDRAGIDYSDPRPVLDADGNIIGTFALHRWVDASSLSRRYRCTCGYGPTTEGDLDTHILEMSKVNDTVSHRPAR